MPHTGKGTLDLPRLWIAAIAIAVAVLGLAPAAAQATIGSSSITSWVTQTTDSHGQTTTLTNAPHVVSFDNAATALTVSGSAEGTGSVNIVCFYGSGQWIEYTPAVAVSGGRFSASALPLRTIAGHTCRLRAIASTASLPASDNDTFAGPQVAVAETGLAAISGGTNNQKPYNYLVSAPTFTGAAGWGAAGSCGPFTAAMTSNFDTRNVAINCAGSLLSDDLGAFGGRSEVRVDGVNAYDAASAQSLFSGGGNPASQALSGFPSLSVPVADWDPTTGLMTSTADEGWAVCHGGTNVEKPTFLNCPSFDPAGVTLERTVTSSDGGRVVTMTDTWSSTDGNAHSLDLLYDDVVGLSSSNAVRGYEFPGQSAFSGYGTGDTVARPAAGPGSILVHTNLVGADGDQSEAFGAITFSSPPSGFAFASNRNLEEHQVLQVPATGSTILTYIYSSGFTLPDATALALDAQDQVQPLAVSITSTANGATTSASPVTVAGKATAGSGIHSVVVAGQTVPVEQDGTWSADVPLNPGSNTINILGTDAAGAIAQGQVTIVYQPPPPPRAEPPPAAKCKVPRTKGMKLPAAERALRRAHCRVGKIKHVKSKKTARGRVMSTTPRAGERLRAGTKVELFVSKGV
jgi:glucodextranase-like protein/PASTA domain-containing protein